MLARWLAGLGHPQLSFIRPESGLSLSLSLPADCRLPSITAATSTQHQQPG